MRTVGLRVVVAISAFMFGVALNGFVNTSTLVEKTLAYPVKSIDSILGSRLQSPERVTFDTTKPSEITFERVTTACFGCPAKRITLRSKDSGGMTDDAIVIETDLQTNQQRQGRLPSYYYRYLMRFIVAQGYFDMNNYYFRGTADSIVVSSSVSVGGRNKSISGNESDLPPALWGISQAIDGVMQHVTWQD
jgi:hypothetical protein